MTPVIKLSGSALRIFLGGGIGFIAWQASSIVRPHPEMKERTDQGQVLYLIGDLKQMSPDWLMGTQYDGLRLHPYSRGRHSHTCFIRRNPEYTTVTDADIKAAIIDYSSDYPNLNPNIIAEVSYADLKSGKIEIDGKQIPTASLSSYPRALKIADTLKEWIRREVSVNRAGSITTRI